MRIIRIKLAGFKSFVDPTSLHLPDTLTGVVGPNGCGKSNIVDAVNWVMGETSAKHLRGDSMADVIFNGSNTRQPVGQASVELVFDNSDGVIGGQYASYSEIAIKRQVSRDGLSTYQLNGTRCRRKDITHLFLGTGLGSRGYSVIEQGMISRVIEAKPEELRTFLEEAAGISKYKERRRETENRIRHTNENIARLDDIREELDKQLTHLERQSKSAEKYQSLKEEERRLKGELLALRWRALQERLTQERRTLAERENAVEEKTASLRGVEAEITRQREARSAATDAFNEVQSRYYAVGSDISRLEQGIQHIEERRRQIEVDLEQARSSVSEAESHIATEEAAARELDEQIATGEPALEAAQAAEREASASLDECEQAMQAWQGEWDAFNDRAAASSHEEQVQQARAEHLQEALSDAEQRLAAARAELEGLRTEPIERERDDLAARLDEANADRERLAGRAEARRQHERELRGRIDRTTEALHEAKDEYQSLRSRIASLEALQQATLGADRDAVVAWLQARGLAEAPRLAAEITVQSGWEQAVEAAIRIPLEALRVDSLAAACADEAALPGGGLTLFEIESDAAEPGEEGALTLPRLADKVRAPWPVARMLGGVYAAASLEQARSVARRLRTHEMVVTPGGDVLGRGWLRMRPPAQEAGTTLAREQELRDLRARAGQDEALMARYGEQLAEWRAELEGLHADAEGADAVDTVQERVTSLRSDLATVDARLDHTRERRARLERELSELEDQIALDQQALETARGRARAAQEAGGDIEAERRRLHERRDYLRERLQQARETWRAARDEVHAANLRVETLRSRRGSLDHSLARYRDLLAQARERCTELEQSLEQSAGPLSEQQRELEAALARRVEVEQALGEARERLQRIEQQVREAEQQRTSVEQALQERRDSLEQARVEVHGLEVKAQDLEEQFQAMGLQVEAALAALAPDRTSEQCTEELERVERRIQRLGPINLAAIDEFTQLSERKQYLDSQHADLTEALATLEGAIRKIDKETRTRFKETFDEVNGHLQRIFPVLFGGGHAYLEMTGEDLLETGVTVMARPPGKRNSNIHLLSGGEKALTALALVFAIFELNPAPFCLLDEVDAPLDDANVVRFCELLKSMASNVQFIVVTHNKITMEIAEQLIGVTMQEPGVSRLVAVDMDEAVEMAATA